MIKKHFQAPPSPPGHWFWGNKDGLHDPLSFMQGVAREYGGIAALRFLNQRAWLVTEPSAIESVLVTQATHFRKHYVLRRLPVSLGDGLLTSDGDTYARNRRLIQPAFFRSQMQTYFDAFVSQTQQMLDRLGQLSSVNIIDEMHQLTLNTASKTLFGTDGGSHTLRVRRALREGQRQFSKQLTSIIRLPAWVPTPSNVRLRRATKELDDIIYGIIRERRESKVEHNDFLDRLIRAQSDQHAKGMTEKQLRDECLTMFLAGQETSALALSWCWYYLGKFGWAAERIYEEVDRVLGGRVPTLEDLQHLKEVEFALYETMRLSPPIYVIGREAKKDLVVGGFECKKGTTLLIPLWVVHRDPRYYTEPDKFRPMRWKHGLAERLPRGAYLPFSIGPRTCPGANFAMIQMKVVIAMLASRIKFNLIPGQNIFPKPEVTLRPAPGVYAAIEPR